MQTMLKFILLVILQLFILKVRILSALENHDRRVREDEIEFVIKRLIKDYDSSYTLTVDKSRHVIEIHVDK